MFRRSLALSVLTVAVLSTTAHAGAGGAKPCRRSCSDTTAPSVSIGSPAGGATIAGTVMVAGTAADDTAVAAVYLAVDSGAWQAASGTASWSYALGTTAFADGTHTLAARAVDAAGNARVATITVTFRNDTTAPAVAISAPAAGATVSGTTNVTGTASDNAAVSRVEVSVDNGAWQPAAGTASWSYALNTAAYADGTHSVAARATDTAGNARTVTTSVTVRNATQATDTTAPAIAIATPAGGATVSGTTSVTGSASDNAALARVDVSVDGGAWQPASGTASWSYALGTTAYANGSHTVTARATDTAGNTRTASVAVTVSNSTSTTAQSWTSPEGAKIYIDSAGGWTVSQVYQMLKDNAAAPGDFSRIAPSLTVKVQDTSASQTATGASTTNNVYTSFSATLYLKGVNSTFATQPDAQMGHEYGHVWTLFHLYMDQQGDWSSYLDARGLTGNPNLGTSYTWDCGEIVADDYRLLFGSSLAVSERPRHLNSYIADPRDVPGLRDFFLTRWAA